MVDQYIFSGSLPENASTYVTREADAQLYEGLKVGKFCYVLNSRQSGKSSLRVRTMQKLREDGVKCAAIDLSASGIQNVPPEQWYADLIDTLIDNFELNLDFRDWWSANELNSFVTRFRKFLEEILLVEIQDNIVIFIDEIDSVLSLKFPTDDFFALIRACYNNRVDIFQYNRLTFCLLGVASPSNLIEDKQRTPFNIGQAISLKGFQLHEVAPLEKGLQERFSNPKNLMKEILDWTGGQPFLTQKVCQFLIDESEKNNFRSVEQVVKLRIVENWESQDEPEHLRTIRDRILRNEQRAGRLLGLYQQIVKEGEVIADDNLEQIELQLSGLVAEKYSKLTVYNKIYKFVFNSTWVDKELNNLRPYAQAIKAWLDSDYKDESRLLRGQALQDALIWAIGKSLSNRDYQFLNASQAIAWKSLGFKFTHREASTIPELITLCDDYPEEGEYNLFNGYFEQWLVAHLGKTDLANFSHNIQDKYYNAKSKGLEIFVRQLCISEKIEPFPKIFLKPDRLDLGEIPIGFRKNLEVVIVSEGRGFVWGSIILEPTLPGLTVPHEFNYLNQKEINISLDTIDVKTGNYNSNLILSVEDVNISFIIPISYKVTTLIVSIEPQEIDLGILKHTSNKRYVDFSLNLTCTPPNGRIRGNIKNNLYYLKIEPNKFEDSFLTFGLRLDTSHLSEGSSYTEEIFLETNIGNYQIPIKFQMSKSLENIIGMAVFVSVTPLLLVFSFILLIYILGAISASLFYLLQTFYILEKLLLFVILVIMFIRLIKYNNNGG
ncbi:MAG: AAA-like domain-containing protein [Nostoc sp. ChiSLP01]|nr:AAA-like domain-containing protein [Nostoc sp. CmiSLP01]MDZ8286361.1 AAA-like domain-containing protein [Nostoc sp. ChiSLP01]